MAVSTLWFLWAGGGLWDNDITLRQGGSQLGPGIGLEDVTVYGLVDDKGSGEGLAGDKGLGHPIAERRAGA